MRNRRAEDLHESEWIRPTTAGRMLGRVHRNTILQRAARGLYRLKVIDGTSYVSRADVERAAKALRRERVA